MSVVLLGEKWSSKDLLSSNKKVLPKGVTETEHYDPQSGTYKIEQRKGDLLLHVTEKSPDGRQKRTTFNPDGSVLSVSEVNAKQQLERLTFHVSKGRKNKVYTFEYDHNGFLVKQKAPFGVACLPVVEEWWRQPVRYTRFSKWNGYATSFVEGEHEPDINEYEGKTKGTFEKGKIVKIVAHDFMDHVRRVTHYRNGQLFQEIFYEIQGKLTRQRRYAVQRKGGFILQTMSEQTFDGKRTCVQTKFVEKMLNLDYEPQLEYTHIDGKLAERVVYCYHGKKYPGEKMECDYNKNGQCVEERFLTCADELLNVVRYEYNAAGYCVDSYKWNGQNWISERNAVKKVPAEIALAPIVAKKKPLACALVAVPVSNSRA